MSPFAAVREADAAVTDAARELASAVADVALSNGTVDGYRIATELATYRAAVEALRVAAAALPGQPGAPSLRVVS